MLETLVYAMLIAFILVTVPAAFLEDPGPAEQE